MGCLLLSHTPVALLKLVVHFPRSSYKSALRPDVKIRPPRSNLLSLKPQELLKRRDDKTETQGDWPLLSSHIPLEVSGMIFALFLLWFSSAGCITVWQRIRNVQSG